VAAVDETAMRNGDFKRSKHPSILRSHVASNLMLLQLHLRSVPLPQRFVEMGNVFGKKPVFRLPHVRRKRRLGVYPNVLDTPLFTLSDY
jgi:hypothetical protein